MHLKEMYKNHELKLSPQIKKTGEYNTGIGIENVNEFSERVVLLNKKYGCSNWKAEPLVSG